MTEESRATRSDAAETAIGKIFPPDPDKTTWAAIGGELVRSHGATGPAPVHAIYRTPEELSLGPLAIFPALAAPHVLARSKTHGVPSASAPALGRIGGRM